MTERPVLILGAGINGAALARELVLNRVPVVIVDTGDIAGGTSAYSSRLIHGGLRYLEYAEFDLVRESLEERNRLLTLASDFVHPLRLYIPVTNRFGGALTQTARFLGWQAAKAPAKGRGLYVVRAGLWMYDRYARGKVLPSQSVHTPGDAGVPDVTSPEVHWLCAYSDGQIPHAERFVVALLEDAAAMAKESNVQFEVRTYCEAIRRGDEVILRPLLGAAEAEVVLAPSAIVNATGAWVDETLRRLQIDAPQLIGGTKGSHFLTFHHGLRTALRGSGVYTEAADGRPIFLLPLGTGTLVGTTDIPFGGNPADAVASQGELEYLLTAANRVFPHLRLGSGDIALHYCGVRPLPKIAAGSPAGITRRHLWRWHPESKVPMVSLIGGKLTTCRAFAEQTVGELLPKLGRKVQATSRERSVRDTLKSLQSTDASARHAIRHQWARTLADLVERRLMLHFEPELTIGTLRNLAQLLIDERGMDESQLESEVISYQSRLRDHFGRGI